MHSFTLVFASLAILTAQVHAQLGPDWDPPAQCASVCEAFSTPYTACYDLPAEPEQAACFCKDENFQALAQCGACAVEEAEPEDKPTLQATLQSSLSYISLGCSEYNKPVHSIDPTTVTYSHGPAATGVVVHTPSPHSDVNHSDLINSGVDHPESDADHVLDISAGLVEADATVIPPTAQPTASPPSTTSSTRTLTMTTSTRATARPSRTPVTDAPVEDDLTAPVDRISAANGASRFSVHCMTLAVLAFVPVALL